MTIDLEQGRARNRPADRPGLFDFGLDEAQEQRASALHRSSIIFDMVSMYAGGAIFGHYSVEAQRRYRDHVSQAASGAVALVDSYFWPFEEALAGRSNLIREWMLESGLTCGAFDIDVPTCIDGDPLRHPWQERFEQICELPWLRQVRNATDIRAAKQDGVIGLYAFYQPVVPLARDITSIDAAYEKGLRSLMLTYNRMDHVGVGCTDRVDAGLSLFGLDVVHRCNELGMIVDVSHCGRATSLDACKASRAPVTANHTAAAAIYAHPRGKDDDVIRAVADTGGVIGIVAVPYFLSGDSAATVACMIDHIDYVANLVGIDHVALGTDWPLQAPDDLLAATMGSSNYTAKTGWSAAYRRDVTQKLAGFGDARDLINITRGLVSHGYADRDVKAVLGENALRVFAEVCGE